MNKFDLIILGGGPAGLTCSIYATRANLKTLIIENRAPGGQINLTETIDNYPGLPNISGFDLAEKMSKQAADLGTEFVFDNCVDIQLDGKLKKIVTEYSGTFLADAIVIATGASPRLLNADGEQKFLGKGVGYCATCDGAFAKNKRVAVVGGGNSAAQEALYLARIAQKVFIFHILEELQCNEVLKQQLFNNPKIEIVFGAKVCQILGDKSINKVVVEKNGELVDFSIDALFVSIGRVPNSNQFYGLDKDKFGYIVANNDLSTNIAGVFVAGDVRQKDIRQIVTACADGAVAADSVAKFLK